METNEAQNDIHPLFGMDFTTGGVPDEPEEGSGILENTQTDPPESNTPTPPDPPASPASPDINTQDYSEHALVALSYQQEHGLVGKDVEIPKDLEAKDMLKILAEAYFEQNEGEKEKWIADRVEAVKAHLATEGVSPEDFAYLAHLKTGGDPNMVARHLELSEYANEVMEDDEDRLERIRYAAELAGQKKEFVEAWITTNLIDSRDIKKADEEAVKTIAAVAEKELKADQARVQQEQAKVQQDWNNYVSVVYKNVETGVKGIKMSKTDQKELVDYMTVKSVTADVVVNGKKVRTKITPYQDFKNKLESSPEKDVAFAYWSLKGDVGLVNAAYNTSKDRFIAAANSRRGVQAQTAETTSMEQEVEGEILMQIGF